MNNKETRIQGPKVCGNEEETGLMVNHGDATGFSEPHALAAEVEKYIPAAIRHQQRFLSNGGKLYIETSRDDASGPSNLERATPECASPSELTNYIRSNEALLVHLVSKYAQKTSKESNGVTEARIHRRVVDGSGNRKGCHDNYSVSLPEITDHGPRGDLLLSHVILGHIATRSFVTGAGYIKPQKDVYFAQKVGGLKKTKGYGFTGSMYRFDTQDGDRLEVRSSDINISDWATRMRIGTTALAVAIAKTPLREALPVLAPHDEMFGKAMSNNRCGSPNPDGSIDNSWSLRQAVAYQRTLASLALEDLEHYTGELDEEVSWTAHELKRYCDDFENVISGDASLDSLADRADWAAKLSRIHEDYIERSKYEVGSSYTDVRAQYLDLKYDHISIKAKKGRLREPKYGYGYLLRNSGAFRGTVPEHRVSNGLIHPPQTTRAKARGDLIKHYKVATASWSRVDFIDKNVTFKAVLDDPNVPAVTRIVTSDYENSKI